MCKHKRLYFGCDDCRDLVKFYDGEIGLQLHNLGIVYNKLQKLVEHGKLGNKTADVILGCLDEMDFIVEGIARETKVNQSSRHRVDVDSHFISMFNDNNNCVESGKRKR